MRDRAVIFDVDGVLVDSYHAHALSWQQYADEVGCSWDQAAFDATFGRTSAAILREYFGLTESDAIRAADDRKEALYRAIVERDFPEMPGARSLIDRLRASAWRLAAGSSGPPENVELALRQLERRDQFEVAITGRDVTRGKPDPQVFQLAAERLGVDPSRAIVIEDAPAGIEAGHAAGMAVIALTSTGRHAAQLADADIIVAHLDEVTADVIDQLVVA